MLRLVIDPGVYVSALLSRRGPPLRLIELWDAGAYEVVVSPAVFGELRLAPDHVADEPGTEPLPARVVMLYTVTM